MGFDSIDTSSFFDKMNFFENLKTMQDYCKLAKSIKIEDVQEFEKQLVTQLGCSYLKHIEYMKTVDKSNIELDNKNFIDLMNSNNNLISVGKFIKNNAKITAIVKLVRLHSEIILVHNKKVLSVSKYTNNSINSNYNKILIFNKYYLSDCFIFLINNKYYSIIWLLMKFLPRHTFVSLLTCNEFNETWLEVGASQDQLIINMFLFRMLYPITDFTKDFSLTVWMSESIMSLLDCNLTILKLLIDKIKTGTMIRKINIIDMLKFETLLQDVVKTDNVKILELLFSLPNAKNFIKEEDTTNIFKLTILSYACTCNSYDCAEYLLSIGASILQVLEFFNANAVGFQLKPKCVEYIVKKANEKVISTYITNDVSERNNLICALRSFYCIRFYTTDEISPNYACVKLTEEELDNLNRNIVYNIFEMVNSIWLLKRKDGILNKFIFKINISYGIGVMRHVLEKLTTYYINKSGLLAPLFESNNYSKSISTDLFDPDHDNMYLPYYVDRPTEFVLKSYEHFGIFLALCFFNEPMELRLSPFFFNIAQNEETLIQCLPTYLSTNLKAMETYTDDDFENLYIMMTTVALNNYGHWKEYELIPGGGNIKVTKNNFKTYKSKLLNFYQAGYRKLILEKIRSGFISISNNSNVMHPHIEYLLINKQQEREPIENWIKYTNIICTYYHKNDYAESTQSPYVSNIIKLNSRYTPKFGTNIVPWCVIWFFEILETLDDNDYNNLLRFIHGSKTLPQGGLSSLAKSNILTISYYKNSNELELPTSATCFNKIYIPWYPSLEVMRKYLLTAIRNCYTFDKV